MSTRSQTPHFMRATEASKNQSSPLVHQSTGHGSSPALNSSVGNTRSLFSSASKKFSYRGWKDRSSTARSSIGSRISSPFNFQRLKDTEYTAPESGNQERDQQPHLLPPDPKTTESLCQSPLDKPLPRVPTDPERLDLPINGLSLIDATEKPLFRSLSPFESSDWPALSPDKQELVETGTMQPRPQQVSLGESVIERVRKLDLNDVEDLTSRTKTEPNTMPPSTLDSVQGNAVDDGEATGNKDASHAKGAKSIQEAASETAPNALKPKSAIPQLRQTKISDLRKRLSSTPLASADCKKPKVELDNSKSPPLRSSLRKSLDHEAVSNKQQRHRSISRHRVTAQGSPYVVPHAAPVRCDDSVRKSIQSNLDLQHDFSPVTAYSLTEELTDPESRSDTSRSTAVKELLSVLESQRKSSIPVPKQRTRKQFPQVLKKADVPADEVTKKLSTSGDNVAEDGDVDTDSEMRRGRKSKRSSCVDRVSNTGSTRNHQRSTPRKSKDIQNPVATDRFGINEHYQQRSPSSLSTTVTIYGEENGEKFKIKPLSRSAPKYGAKLRVSESANDFLLGNDAKDADAFECVSTQKCDSHANVTHPVGTQCEQTCLSESDGEELPLDNKLEGARTGCRSRINTEEAEGETDQSLEPTEASVNQLESSEADTESISQHHVTSAPPVRPGTPVDDSPNIGWPFDETVVLPFKYVEPKPGTRTSESIFSPQTAQVMAMQTADDTIPANRQGNQDHKRLVEGREREAANFNDSTTIRHQHPISKKPQTAFPERVSSRHATKIAARDTPDLQERFHQYVGHEPPQVPGRSIHESTITPLMKNAKSALRGSRPSQISHRHQDKNASSSPANTNSLSTGKSVINNIKGLFHKRSAVGDEGISDRKNSGNVSKPTLKPLTFESPISRPRLQPRSPQVKSTNPSLLERRQARLNELERPFLKHRNVMTVSTTFPMAKNSLSSDNQPHNASLSNSNNDNLASKPVSAINTSRLVDQHQSGEPVELVSATKMVYDVLNRAQDEPRTGHKLHLIELSKLMVQMLHSARDAEKAKEEARQCASRAEVECMKTRMEILEVTALVGKMLSNSGEA